MQGKEQSPQRWSLGQEKKKKERKKDLTAAKTTSVR